MPMMSTVRVWTVELCYDYEGCTLEQVYGTEAEANACVDKLKEGGTSANFEVKEWDVSVPLPSEGNHG